MIYIIYTALALVAYLIVLNEYLRGEKKTQIDLALTLLMLGLIIIAFFVAGWKFGILAFVITFISANITRPIAARTASKLLASSTGDGGSYVGLPPRSLQRISQQLGKPIDPNKRMEEIFSDGLKSNAKSALLDYCEQQPEIQALLKEYKLSRQDLLDIYDQLLAVGAGQWACGHWVAASALAYPESLRYLLNRKGESMLRTSFNLIMYFEQGTALEI